MINSALGKTYLAIIFLLIIASGLFFGQRYVSRQKTVVPTPTPAAPVLAPKAAAPMIPAPSSVSTSSAKTNPSERFHLTVATPKDGGTYHTATIPVSGTTEPNAVVTVNSKSLKADGSGNFSGTITLTDGPSTVVVTASDAKGNYTEKDLEITYTPVK